MSKGPGDQLRPVLLTGPGVPGEPYRVRVAGESLYVAIAGQTAIRERCIVEVEEFA